MQNLTKMNEKKPVEHPAFEPRPPVYIKIKPDFRKQNNACHAEQKPD